MSVVYVRQWLEDREGRHVAQPRGQLDDVGRACGQAKAADAPKTFMEWLVKVNRQRQRLGKVGRSAGSNRGTLGARQGIRFGWSETS